ncbi:MAG: hypothetical protein HQK83_19580 [Fibrobacteria bacterium]|nr:hypothetical protein [Fibrobacteria bacterium]
MNNWNRQPLCIANIWNCVKKGGVVLGVMFIMCLPALAATLEQSYLVGACPTSGWLQGQGWVSTEKDGTIHVLFATKYRTGPTLDSLGEAEEYAPGVKDIWNPRVFLDYQGNPHVVYDVGIASQAKSIWYTTKKDGKWIAPEKVVALEDLASLGVASDRRTTTCYISFDSEGNKLFAYWVNNKANTDKTQWYRWRKADGTWSDHIPVSAGTEWSSLGSAHEFMGKWYLVYQGKDIDYHLAGPVDFGEEFSSGPAAGFMTLASGANPVINEGADFIIGADSTVVIVSNLRRSYSGPTGAVASMAKLDGFFNSPTYLGNISEGHGEGAIHPHAVIDEATGAVVVTYQSEHDKKAYYNVYENGKWNTTPTRIVPEEETDQIWDRTGPNGADLPGRGVVIVYRSGDKIYLRKMMTEGEIDSTVTVVPSKRTAMTGHSRLNVHDGKNLSWLVLFFEEKGENTLTVTDIQGRVMGRYTAKEKSRAVIEAASFPGGLYFITKN